MKKIKKMLLVLAAFVMCIIPVLSTPMTANAAEPVTYYVKYLPDLAIWRFQTGTWVDGGYHRDLWFLKEEIKDGDHLVIDGTPEIKLEVNVNLGSLTVSKSSLAVIAATSIDTVYTLDSSVSSITGNVSKAYVYDQSVANFNNNVSYLEIVRDRAELFEATVAVVGTVDHVKAHGANYTHFELYSFAANSFRLEKGHLETDKSKFSYTAPVVVAPTPSAPVGGYDAVPKTGDVRFNPLWLVGIAGVCLLGSYVIKRKVNA